MSSSTNPNRSYTVDTMATILDRSIAIHARLGAKRSVSQASTRFAGKACRSSGINDGQIHGE
jgi:urease alpha subunit